MELFTLAAKLVMDTSGFSQSVGEAEKHGSSLNDKLGKIVKTAAKVAAALVFKKGVSAMKQLAEAAAAAGDKIDKQSQALGLSRKAYQEWGYILSQNGSSIDSLGVSMKTLNNSILSNNQSVTKLGLSFEKLDNMNMEQQFEAVVKAFQEMPAGAEKSALAVELFGRNGMELLPLLNNSATSIDELRQKFHDLGMEMTDDQINSAVRYTDAMDTLNRVFDGIKYTIGAELLPTMANWAEKAADYAGKLLKAYKDDGLSGVFKTLDKDISAVTKNMKESGNPVLETLGTIIDGIKEGIKIVIGLFTDFPGTVKSLKESDSAPMRVLGNAIDAVGVALQWIIDNQEIVIAAVGAIIAAFAISKIVSIAASFNPIVLAIEAVIAVIALLATNWETISKYLTVAWQFLSITASNIWNGIKTTAITVWETIKTTITTAWEGIKSATSTVWEAIKKTITGIWDGIKTTASTVWESIKTAITTVWDSIKTTASTVWESIKTVITGIWDGINSTASTVWESIKTAVTTPIDAVKTTLSTIWESIKSTATTAWNAVSNAITPVINGIKGVIQGVINTVKDVITWFKKLMGYNGETLSKTKSEHTHTNTTINRVINDGMKNFNDSTGILDAGVNAVAPLTGQKPDVVTTVWDAFKTAVGWKKNAKGNWAVPYDDFPALLHRNEMVLTASQARRYREGEGGMDVRQVAEVVGSEVRKALKGVGIYMGADKVADITANRMNNNIGVMNAAILHGMGG